MMKQKKKDRPTPKSDAFPANEMRPSVRADDSVSRKSSVAGADKLRKVAVATGSAMKAARSIRNGKGKGKGGGDGQAKDVVSTPCAIGPAREGPVCYNYLLSPGNNSRVILAVMR